MFGTLFESRARRQRRTGGVALSVAVHLTIIGAVAATAAPKDEKPEPIKPTLVKLLPPSPEPRRTTRPLAPKRASSPSPVSSFVLERVVHIDVPTIVPTSLPEIVAVGGPPIDSIIIGSGRSGKPGGKGLSLIDLVEEPGNPWRGAELVMRIVTSGKPRYPETLRQAGIGGRVLVRFVVDTLGRIDPASVAVVSSTHDRFSQAVRDALGAFRFRPAEASGKRVPALAEMPFEFTVTR